MIVNPFNVEPTNVSDNLQLETVELQSEKTSCPFCWTIFQPEEASRQICISVWDNTPRWAIVFSTEDSVNSKKSDAWQRSSSSNFLSQNMFKKGESNL